MIALELAPWWSFEVLGYFQNRNNRSKRNNCCCDKNFNPGCPQVDWETYQRKMSEIIEERCYFPCDVRKTRGAFWNTEVAFEIIVDKASRGGETSG